jgi:hypothetical protein
VGSVDCGSITEGAVEDELTGCGGNALAIPTDVTDYDQVKKLVDAT